MIDIDVRNYTGERSRYFPRLNVFLYGVQVENVMRVRFDETTMYGQVWSYRYPYELQGGRPYIEPPQEGMISLFNIENGSPVDLQQWESERVPE